MNTFIALQSIGFSEYEAKTYLALLESAPATGYQVSKNSGVPRSMIYEVLNRLQSRGIVLVSNDEENAQYKPLPPSALLDQYRSSLDATLSYLKPELERIFTEDRDSRIWALNDRGSIIAYAEEMLAGAISEVTMLLNDTHFTSLEESLTKLTDNDLTINILTTGELTPQIGTITHHPPLESQLQGLEDTLLLLVDNQEVLIANTSNDPNATITTNTNLILIARQFMWMEVFTQRILSKFGREIVDELDMQDREILLNLLNQD